VNPEPVDAVALARLFEYFALHECAHDPLYVALCRLVAGRPDLLALLGHAPPTQRTPNLLLAALHDRVLAGAPQRLREYFPGVGGMCAPDDELPAALDAFIVAQRAELTQLLATRNTQTNEIGRCAVLWPALCALAARTGSRRLALLDFGCSAGLNLGVDGYCYDYGAFALGAAAGPDVPLVTCRPLGAESAALQRLGDSAPQLVQREGIDPAAVDVHDAARVRWLRACLWPYDHMRRARFDAALALAQRQRFTVRRCDDCAAAIEPWLDRVPAGVMPVVFNSWVLHYLDKAARRSHIAFMRDLVQRRGVAWLSAEGFHIPIGTAPPLAPVLDATIGDDEVAKGSLWWLLLPDRGAGEASATLLARSHPHGWWVQWL
jgi:hypothetical protein